MNHAPYSTEASQGWHSPGPPPSASPESHLANAPQTSDGYPPVPITTHSHLNPTCDSGPPDASSGDLKYNQKVTQGSEPASKPPPLPVSSFFPISTFHLNVALIAPYFQPRPHNQISDQPASPESKTPSSRLSTTTIDVPLFLQPIAYDPASAPPSPGLRRSLPKDVQTSILSPSEPGRLPPPPPQKIPLKNTDISQVTISIPQRPAHDPQHSSDNGQQKDSQISQRPRFDPQNSHDNGIRPYQWKSDEQRPTIPVPQFTNFDVESALPPPEPYPESSLAPQQTLPQSTTAAQSVDLHSYEAGNKSSILPVNLSAADRRVQILTPRGTQATYTSSSKQQHAVLSPPDGQSISTTDLSINTVSVSSPGSHQISNTSYRKNENRERTEQQGGDSFYWHSGRSSSEVEEDLDHSGSPTATPGGDSVGQRSSATNIGLQCKHQDLPIRSTSLSPTASATYGASALGFGGPSDWEYFGDYEAEEIDDEELYSRPRQRDLKSMVQGSTELPVDSPLDSVHPFNKDSNLPGSDSMRLEHSSVHETCPTRPLEERSSEEHLVQDLIVLGEGNCNPDGKPRLARGPAFSPVVSSQAVSSTDNHSQQRPDLDDVIRAWSEAPYVGKIHEIPPVAAVVPNEDKKPASDAEASSVATPRERVLGVDVISKDALTLPKLPDLVDSQNPDERGLHRNANALATPTNAVSIAANHEQQVQAVVNLQDPAAIDMVANAEVNAREEGKYTLESEDMMQAIMQPVDVVTSSGLPVSIRTRSSIKQMISEDCPSTDISTDSRRHNLPQASRNKTPTDSDGKPCDLSQMNHLEQDHQKLQIIVQKNQKKRKRRSEEAKSELSQTLEGKTSSEAIITVSPKEIESLSQEDSLSDPLIVPPDTAREDHSLYLARNISEENPCAGDSFKSRQDHSQEDVKTPMAYVAGDPPLDNNPTGAPSQANLPPLTSDVSLSHDTDSIDIGVVQDPYSDLDPWGKASLNRFAAMLREESRAETNQDKLNIFNVFTSRESRLRVVLYGTDDELIVPQNPVRQEVEIIKKPEKIGFVKQVVERANSIGLERSLKALPALPVSRESVIGLPGNVPASSVLQHGSTRNGRVVGRKSMASEDASRSKDESGMPRRPLVDDSSVMVDPSSDGVQYSPGGRPVVARLPEPGRATNLESLQDAGSASNLDRAASSKTPGSSRHAHSPSINGPIATGFEDLMASDKHANRLLKYNEGHSEVKNYLTNRKSVCRPYATLTQGSLESASTFGKEEDIKLAGVAGSISAPTSQYNPALQAKSDGFSDTKEQEAPRNKEPNDLRRFVKADFDPLLLALPNSDAVVHVSARILDLRNIMEAVPDDFGFIHQSVVAWDAKAKKQREDNDRQRHIRQAESEQKIDLLFDDHEIGYGDIAELETEFKRAEAARKADEDRFEYQTFVSDVFNLVWTRLHYELDQLIPHYDQYSNLMDHTLAGKDMFEVSKEGLALGPTMSSFLALHQKIEIRHQKAFEAVLERDRRLKKTEISPWYSLSNIAKVKQLEKQFEDAEKRAIIEYCLQRDARANQLMDVLDQNTLRGVGANQDYMEAIMKAVRRIASGRAFASVPSANEPTAGLEEVEKARAVTALLASSSEQVVQTFHVADMLLNSADYEVSVAKAKVAKADMATLAKLKEERAKEDQKLMRDLEHRLALIREDTRRTNDEIVKLMLFLGLQNGRADSAPLQAEPIDEPIDPQHQARIQKALEEAKRRNALKESEG